MNDHSPLPGETVASIDNRSQSPTILEVAPMIGRNLLILHVRNSSEGAASILDAESDCTGCSLRETVCSGLQPENVAAPSPNRRVAIMLMSCGAVETGNPFQPPKVYGASYNCCTERHEYRGGQCGPISVSACVARSVVYAEPLS